MRPAVSLPVAILAGFAARLISTHERDAAFPSGGTPGERQIVESATKPLANLTTDAKMEHLLSVASTRFGSLDRDDELFVAIEAFGAEDLRRVPGDIVAFKKFAEKLRKAKVNARDVFFALIERWLAVDSAAAIGWLPEFATKIPIKDGIHPGIVSAFAEERPAETLEVARTLKTAAMRAPLIEAALREIASRDLAKAKAWLAGCEDPDDRRAAEQAIRAGSVEAEPQRVAEIAGSAPNAEEADALVRSAIERAARTGTGVLRQLATTPLKPSMLSLVLNQLADRDPAAAVDIALGQSSFGTGERTAFGALARKDVAQALAKLDGLSGRNLGVAMGAICSALAKEDPAAAMAWLSEKQAAEKAGSKRDEILINTFSEWTTAEPQAAAAWAGSLPVGEMRKTVQNALATSLFRTGQCDEAARILSSLGSDANRFAIWGMARAWVGKDPQAAADWAATQPPGGLQAESLSAVVSSWALDNPRGVQDWLAQFPAGEVRDKCINAFLGRMDMQADRSLKQAEFDTWFERVEDPWRRTKLAVWNYRTMKQHDPIAARAWLSALPNVDADLVRMTLYE